MVELRSSAEYQSKNEAFKEKSIDDVDGWADFDPLKTESRHWNRNYSTVQDLDLGINRILEILVAFEWIALTVEFLNRVLNP